MLLKVYFVRNLLISSTLQKFPYLFSTTFCNSLFRFFSSTLIDSTSAAREQQVVLVVQWSSRWKSSPLFSTRWNRFCSRYTGPYSLHISQNVANILDQFHFCGLNLTLIFIFFYLPYLRHNQGSFISEMEWAPVQYLIWNPKNSIVILLRWLDCFYYKRCFFVIQTLL